MYKLTLTQEERKAIDWVGYRYAHGHELERLLWVESEQDPSTIDWIETASWSNPPQDITFKIPEHVAWEIKDIIDQDNGSLACFGDELKKKLWDFSSSII